MLWRKPPKDLHPLMEEMQKSAKTVTIESKKLEEQLNELRKALVKTTLEKRNG